MRKEVAVLILGLKLNEGLTVSVPGHGEIHVAVTQIRRGQVKLGITAPLELAILRDEVRNREAIRLSTEGNPWKQS